MQAGGPYNLGCLARDYTNFIATQRRLRIGEGDAEAIKKLFILIKRWRFFFI